MVDLHNLFLTQGTIVETSLKMLNSGGIQTCVSPAQSGNEGLNPHQCGEMPWHLHFTKNKINERKSMLVKCLIVKTFTFQTLRARFSLYNETHGIL